MSAPDFPAWSALALARVEQALTDWVPAAAPARLGDAMRYAVLDGGKRLRPLLVLASAEAVQGNGSAALRAACAVELIHAYSLVHDDMPCMDNDVLRRGKPTVHVQYGEAQALLAGDALQALAFELLTPEGDAVPPAMQAALCGLLARAAGAAGMAGGQAIDLASVGRVLTEAELRAMHRLKTGALLQAAVRMGAACAAPALPVATRAALDDYGAAIGLAFQVSTTSWMSPPTPSNWARPPARTPRPTSPPTCPCWVWPRPRHSPRGFMRRRTARSMPVAWPRWRCCAAWPTAW